jgi:AcrR family transcriptional regulator
MQILKEEVRQKLFERATDEFMEKGFENASLRQIARDAGTTIGNVYNYFKSKEELFYAVTAPVYESFTQFLFRHEELPATVQGAGTLRKALLGVIDAHRQAFSKPLVILLEGSRGTRYENVKEEILTYLARHAKETLDQLPSASVEFHPAFPRVLATSFLEGVMSILKANTPPEDAAKLLTDYILFYSRGVSL